MKIVKGKGGKVTIEATGKAPREFDSLEAALEAMATENAAMEAAQAEKTTGVLSFKARPKGEQSAEYQGKTTEMKGNIGAYGLQRMPVTLYASQWMRLFTDGPSKIAAVILNTPVEKLDFKGGIAERDQVIAWAKAQVSK